ncbi:NAD(P)H-dependent oxidoreductase [Trueperella bernardiae]|uniref:NAD(P)H-dependent oxidoreductase n=1 Tax=Trueperella bernardiae TaxID=59561 RepID=UPI0032E85A72
MTLLIPPVVMSSAEATHRAGHEVEVIDLASEEFDPALRFGYRQRMHEEACTKTRQELLQRCDQAALAFPVWWAGEPSLLKGWFNRVLTPGNAYRYLSGNSFTMVAHRA